MYSWNIVDSIIVAASLADLVVTETMGLDIPSLSVPYDHVPHSTLTLWPSQCITISPLLVPSRPIPIIVLLSSPLGAYRLAWHQAH